MTWAAGFDRVAVLLFLPYFALVLAGVWNHAGNVEGWAVFIGALFAYWFVYLALCWVVKGFRLNK